MPAGGWLLPSVTGGSPVRSWARRGGLLPAVVFAALDTGDERLPVAGVKDQVAAVGVLGVADGNGGCHARDFHAVVAGTAVAGLAPLEAVRSGCWWVVIGSP